MSDLTPLPTLRYGLPLPRGEAVMTLQRLLRRADPDGAGREIRVVDGLFGPATRRAVIAFQARAGLAPDGVVGPRSWAALGAPQPAPLALSAEAVRDVLGRPHAVFSGGATWRLTRDGVVLDGVVLQPAGSLAVRRAFDWFGDAFRTAARDAAVPIELLVACACTEVLGDTRRFADADLAARARREEPGWTDDAATPHRVSVGVMQMLLSTARRFGADGTLEDPARSIRLAARMIADQAAVTRLDPPVVACAYNAGGVYEQRGAANHWRMRQYPIGTPRHADRFVAFFNQAMALLAAEPARAGAAPSFRALLA